MKKGTEVKISDLQGGDYFQDEIGMKFRKIPPVDILGNVFNCFDLQEKCLISVNEDIDVIFIKHSPWDNAIDMRSVHWPSIEESELEHQIEFFKDYLEMMEKYLESEIQECTLRLGVYPANHEPDYERTYEIGEMTVRGDLVAYEIGTINQRLIELDEYANLLRKSCFMSLYSYLESSLNKECELRKKDNAEIKLSLKDIHGTGINRAKIYLVKVLGSNFPFTTNSCWEEIQNYRKLRNCIAHNEGIVTNNGELKKYIDKNEYLSYEKFFGDEILMIDENYCRVVLSTVHTFLRSMLHYREANKL